MTRPGAGRPVADPATEAVETTMYRALAVLRLVVLANAIGLNLYRWDNIDHPTAAVVVLLVMSAWTAFRSGPTTSRAAGAGRCWSPTSPSPWPRSASRPGSRARDAGHHPRLLGDGRGAGWGIRAHWVGGLVAAAAVSADLAVRTDLDQNNYGNIFLLMIGGPILGYASGCSRRWPPRGTAPGEAAAAAERAGWRGWSTTASSGARWCSAVGSSSAGRPRSWAGWRGSRRWRCARSCRGEAPVAGATSAGRRGGGREQRARRPGGVAGAARLAHGHRVGAGGGRARPGAGRAGGGVRRTRVPGQRRTPRRGPRGGVGAAGGPRVVAGGVGARRGDGIEAGRLEEAAHEGRLGVAESVRGRVADLGGTAALVTAPGQGTEWEFTLPR